MAMPEAARLDYDEDEDYSWDAELQADEWVEQDEDDD